MFILDKKKISAILINKILGKFIAQLKKILSKNKYQKNENKKLQEKLDKMSKEKITRWENEKTGKK